MAPRAPRGRLESLPPPPIARGQGGDAVERARESLRQFAAFFRQERLTVEMRAAQREVVLARAVVLIWISVFVMPTTIWSYVYFLAPAILPTAVWIVLAAIGAVLVHRQLVLRGVFDRHYHLAMLLLVGGVFGPTGAAIVEITRGSQGDFFFAFFLIYFAFTSLFPADVRWVLATSAAIVSSYTGARLFRPEGLVFDAALTTSLIYLLELTFIGVVLNRVLCKLFFDEQRSRVELAKANEGLRELDQAKTSFFSNVSHEIRTPLTLIITPITHLLQTHEGRLDPDLTAKLEGVRGNANRLLKMVNSLLDFAKIEAGQATVSLAELDVDDVVRYAAGLFAGTAEDKGVTLDVSAGSGGLTVQSDLDKLEKILVNLIGNALKFTPSGGSITVESARAGGHYELTVSDTGIGIPSDQLTAVFKRFTQVEAAHQGSVRGTGIGLSMVHEYSKLLGGEVRAESESGAGSTFTVRLPIEPPVARRAPVTAKGRRERSRSDAAIEVADLVGRPAIGAREVQGVGPGRRRVLVVDDNPALVGLVSSILAPDYDLYLASSGEEALERLATSEVDLVVSDVMMPGISGLELCRRIKTTEKTRHLPVVLLTARGGTMQKVEGLEHGADDYIGKPFDPEELKARLRSLFELRSTTQTLVQKSAELEETLRKLKDEEVKVIEAEKMRTLGELAAGMLHELHNYLNMICNGATPLKDGLQEVRAALKDTDVGGAEIAELVELADLVLASAASARDVTGELKGFAHQDSHAGKLVDVHTVIQSTVRLFGKRPGLSIDLHLSSSPLIIEAVPSRLTQVFTNLLKNAHEAMNGSGVINITSAKGENGAVITVTDTGPGVPESHRAKLFEPFQTTKKQGEGLGLGLSLSRKALHDLRGDLRYDAAHAGGARFVITLPSPARLESPGPQEPTPRAPAVSNVVTPS